MGHMKAGARARGLAVARPCRMRGCRRGGSGKDGGKRRGNDIGASEVGLAACILFLVFARAAVYII